MIYPTLLLPTERERIELPTSGHCVDLPKTFVVFDAWQGAQPADRYRGKALLDWGGSCTFAEIAILRIFQAAGWEGCWVDTFSRKYRVDYWGDDTVREIPVSKREILSAIQKGADRRGGCFDVFCWQNDNVCFAEAKRRGHDKIRDSQRAWLEGALNNRLTPERFLIVEWNVRI